MKKKIGLYGGTFDPIHYGHLNLVIQVMELRALDEVWLIPTGVNPFKIDKDLADAKYRLDMTRKAAEPFPNLKVMDNELRREGVSYAIDTLKEFFQRGGDDKYSIIIGDDAAKGFFKWKDVNEIVEMVPVFVGRRSCDFNINDLEGDPQVLQALKKGMTDTRIVEISSTEIRERISKGLNCRHLVPSKVMDIIYKKHLYS
jgi:nicotinate-nucleotide adenylyltransferase